MKSLKTVFVLFLFFITVSLSAQNLIGYKLKDIRKYMRENQKSMSWQGLTFNKTFKYAKFADRDGMQTTLFFLTADTVCKGIRMVCDKSMKLDMLKDLDSKYKKSGPNQWTGGKEGTDYLIELREEEWTFNVTISIKD